LYGKKGQKVPPEDHPAAKYHWKAGVAKENAKIPSEPQSNGSSNGSLKRSREKESPKSVRPTRKSARVGS
jgi:hypothetical protein